MIELDQTIFWVAVSLLVGAFVKGTTGMGFPLIATPIVTLLLDIRVAIAILIIPNIVMDTTQVLRKKFPSDVFSRFAWLMILTLVGVFLGTKVLVMLPIWSLDLSLGIVTLAFVFSNIFQFEFHVPPRVENYISPIVGLLGGFIMGLTNAGGPLFAIYLYSLKLAKTDFIKSIATIFIINKVGQLIAVSTWNLFTPAIIQLSLLVTLFSLLGFGVGLKYQDRVNQKTFNGALLILLFLIGAMLVVRSLW